MLNAKYIVKNHSKIIFIFQKSIAQLQGSKTQSKYLKVGISNFSLKDHMVHLLIVYP